MKLFVDSIIVNCDRSHQLSELFVALDVFGGSEMSRSRVGAHALFALECIVININVGRST